MSIKLYTLQTAAARGGGGCTSSRAGGGHRETVFLERVWDRIWKEQPNKRLSYANMARVAPSCPPRNIYVDMGVNWCNTLELWRDASWHQPNVDLARPWIVIGWEASELIVPHASRCVVRLNAGEPLPEPPVPPTGSSAEFYRYVKSRPEFGKCFASSHGDIARLKALVFGAASPDDACWPVMRANASLVRPDPALSRNEPLLQRRLAAAQRCPPPLRGAPSANYTLVPAAAGDADGNVTLLGDSLPQMMLGGAHPLPRAVHSEEEQAHKRAIWTPARAGGERAPVTRSTVRRVDAVRWLLDSVRQWIAPTPQLCARAFCETAPPPPNAAGARGGLLDTQAGHRGRRAPAAAHAARRGRRQAGAAAGTRRALPLEARLGENCTQGLILFDTCQVDLLLWECHTGGAGRCWKLREQLLEAGVRTFEEPKDAACAQAWHRADLARRRDGRLGMRLGRAPGRHAQPGGDSLWSCTDWRLPVSWCDLGRMERCTPQPGARPMRAKRPRNATGTGAQF